MVNKTRLIESIADLVKDKRIEGISDLNDESSSRTGMKIVIEIKKDANPQVVLNQLYRYTQLQDTVGVIMLALDDGVPKIMSLKTMMERYIEFQMQVIRRRTAFDLKKAKEREHILEGLHKAVDIVDEIIATIRACKGGFAEARQAVMDNFGFDELQADAIVKLQLGRLAGLEILKIEQELGELRTAIADYEDILANDEHVKNIVKTDLTTLADKYGDSLSKSQFPTAIAEMTVTLNRLNTTLDKVNNGEGTVGKFVNDQALYDSLVDASANLSALLYDIKAHPKRYINISVFGGGRNRD